MTAAAYGQAEATSASTTGTSSLHHDARLRIRDQGHDHGRTGALPPGQNSNNSDGRTALATRQRRRQDDEVTHRTPSCRRAVTALTLAVMVVAGSCGDESTPGNSEGTDSVTSTELPTTTSAPDDLIEVSVYLTRAEQLGPVSRQIEDTEAVLRSTLEQLLDPPAVAETDAGFASEIPTGTTLNDVAIADGTATVDLSDEFVAGGGSLSIETRVAQVVFTATQFPTVDDVLFAIDGAATTAIGGEGYLVEDPATRTQFENVLPPVLVDAPAWGAVVGTEFTAMGSSNAFEATHQFEVTPAGGGATYASGFTTASSGSGERGRWEQTVQLPSAAAGEAVFTVFVESAQDGSREDQIDVAITLAP